MYKIQLACVTSNHARDLSKLLLITVSVSLHFHILSRHIIFFILEYNFHSLLSLHSEFWASAFNYHSEYKNFLSLNFTLWFLHPLSLSWFLIFNFLLNPGWSTFYGKLKSQSKVLSVSFLHRNSRKLKSSAGLLLVINYHLVFMYTPYVAYFNLMHQTIRFWISSVNVCLKIIEMSYVLCWSNSTDFVAKNVLIYLWHEFTIKHRLCSVKSKILKFKFLILNFSTLLF